MNQKILVTYASRGGSTAEIATAIGETLAQAGAQVDVLPMQAVTDLTPYSAVVAGSPIQSKQWLPEALRFVEVHQAQLARKPFAVFLACMTLAMKKGDYRSVVSTWIDPVCALVRPVSRGLFAGTLNLRAVPSLGTRLMFRISIAMGIWSAGDHRDWDAIHAWAASLPPLLRH